MNHLAHLLFYCFSVVTIVSSIVVITNRRPAYAVLSLAVAMLALSGLFVLLEAYFVAAIQILIYAGAILVLFLFVIMLLGIEGEEKALERKKSVSLLSRMRRFIGLILPVIFFCELAVIFSAWKGYAAGGKTLAGTVEAVGLALFTKYLLPFELISGILLIGIFGIVNLAGKEFQEHA